MDQLLEADNGLGEVMKPPEKSFWAKYVSYCPKYLFILFNFSCVCNSAYLYVPTFSSRCLQWMYIIPLGLIVMNAVTAAANIPEEQAAGQGQPGARAPAAAAARRR